MGVFRTRDTFQVWTEIKGVSRQRAIESLHDHDFFINQDPNLEAYKGTKTPRGGVARLPADCQEVAIAPTECYEVTDRIPARFARLIPGKSCVVNRYQVTNLEDGIYVNLQAALDVVSERRILIRGGDEEGERSVTLVQEVALECNKMLVGVFRGQFEEHWRRIHENFAKKMGGEVVSNSKSVC